MDRSLPHAQARAIADRIGIRIKDRTTEGSDVSFVPPQDSHDGTSVEFRDCERCAQFASVVASFQASEAELVEDRDLADREVRRLRKANALLQRELIALREEDPKAKEIREVLDHWKSALRKKGNTKTPIDGKRADAVRRAQRWGYSVADIKQAIDGAARFPFVVNALRVATGPPERRYDDLETILKGEGQIDKLMALAVGSPVQQSRLMGPTKLPRVEIDELLGKLEQAREEKAGQWMARCPSHDDRHASLAIAFDERGIGLHCNTGCDVAEIAGALGYAVTQLFSDNAGQPTPKRPATPPESLPSPTELATLHGRLLSNPKLLTRLTELRGWTKPTLERLYVGFDGQRIVLPIHDGEGQLVNVLRYLPGERPEGARKLLAARGRTRELFPSPERFDATEVWLLEGEPDAIAAHELGLTGFGVPGSNGWRPAWAPRFQGRVVVVCFDCDQPGRDAAQRVANSLIEEAREVRVVDLSPDRSDGFDLSDFVHDGGHVRDLLRMAAASSAIHALRSVA